MADPQTVPPPTPDTPEATPPDTGSLRDHEAEFGKPERRALIREETQPVDRSSDEESDPEAFNAPRQAPKYRAKSQQAKPDDVKTIQEYTKRLRDAEAQIGVVVERKDGESERVYNLRRRAELAEAIRDTKKAAIPSPQPQARVPDASDFAEAEPVITDFANTADPYTFWMRAVNAYDIRKSQHDLEQGRIKIQQQLQHEQIKQRKDEAYRNFGNRINAFKAQTRDYEDVVKSAADVPATPLLETALVNHERGPEFIYRLAQDRRLADELFLLTDNKPVTQLTVGQVQRLLEARLSTVVAGSVGTPAYVPPPKPPNPARSGAMKVAETPPGDSGSLADHEKFYGRGLVRRRA